MKKNKILVKFIPITILAIVSTFTIANAATVGFSYEGWNIRGKDSANSAYASAGSTVYVDHYQKADHPVGGTLQVSIYKKKFWGASLFHRENFSGNGYFICGKCYVSESGNYFLNFSTTSDTLSYPSFYINGDFVIE